MYSEVEKAMARQKVSIEVSSPNHQAISTKMIINYYNLIFVLPSGSVLPRNGIKQRSGTHLGKFGSGKICFY